METDKTLSVKHLEEVYEEADGLMLEGVNTLKELCERFPESAECRIYDV